MKKALIILLVATIVLTGIPLFVGMAGMGNCHDCGPAIMGATGCAGILVSTAMFIAMLVVVFRPRRVRMLQLLVADSLYRPPRLG
ncbi:MAG: hypothetical protein H0W70_00190 [Actinobacteria bacterium]|nr:hypothetical protein [Actinomycetota bacterium]